VWDLATLAPVATHAFDNAQIGDMQNGVLWLDASTVVAVSLNGDLTLLDPASGPSRTVHGHQVRKRLANTHMCATAF
jgi:hypothetical protein